MFLLIIFNEYVSDIWQFRLTTIVCNLSEVTITLLVLSQSINILLSLSCDLINFLKGALYTHCSLRLCPNFGMQPAAGKNFYLRSTV